MKAINRRACRIAALVLVLIISLACFCPLLKNPKTYSGIINSLDQKRTIAVGLMTGSTVVSLALSCAPDDIATPIAQELAALSKLFLIIIAALLLEKYLAVIFGFMFSAVILPLFSILLIIREFSSKKRYYMKLALKVLSAGVVFLILIPAANVFSNLIDDVFEESIQQTLQETEEMQSAMENADENGNTENLWEKVKGSVSGLMNKTVGVLTWAKLTLSRYIESLAVMLVTVCMIPLLTAYAIFSIMKRVLRLDLSESVNKAEKAVAMRLKAVGNHRME